MKNIHVGFPAMLISIAVVTIAATATGLPWYDGAYYGCALGCAAFIGITSEDSEERSCVMG